MVHHLYANFLVDKKVYNLAQGLCHIGRHVCLLSIEQYHTIFNAMKTLSITTLLPFLLCITSCKSDIPVYSEKLEKALSGLNKITLTEKETRTVLHLIDDTTQLKFPVYSLEGNQLTLAQIREKEMNMTVDCFGDDPENIKAVVFRSLTRTELADFFNNLEEAAKKHQKNRVDLRFKPAPLFTAKDIDGNQVDLAALKGKVVVLNFWFIGCFPCVQEMPELNETVQAYQGQDVVFLGLTFDKGKETKAFLQRTKFDYRIIAEAKSIIDLYGGGGFPRNIVIDKTGTVIASEVGYKPYQDVSRKNLRSAIDKALGAGKAS